MGTEAMSLESSYNKTVVPDRVHDMNKMGSQGHLGTEIMVLMPQVTWD